MVLKKKTNIFIKNSFLVKTKCNYKFLKTFVLFLVEADVQTHLYPKGDTFCFKRNATLKKTSSFFMRKNKCYFQTSSFL